ncbi:hypothetical protein MFUM_200074 [Methylacidiphilum fumariolicum SolV]|uniref:Uncharacterized protein n=2 Tax=Candidatus Methylacidiphilum fumarolicum TaxID=591154 RepID=I0JWZ0_METFB|nr:conserved protein of unknown function [Candidatus Methylacidiphilum fumarolicum]CCG91759.1 hypothetical protein MFUM_200074 [Methylacidiphilum fumariolicum SolV]
MGKNIAGCLPVDLPGLWNTPGPGREDVQESLGVWLGSTRLLYGEFRRI